MKKIKDLGDELSQILRKPEAAHVLEMAGANGIDFSTRTSGRIDGVEFCFQSSASDLDASMVLTLDKEIVAAMDKDRSGGTWTSNFRSRCEDRFDRFSGAVEKRGYWQVEVEFGRGLRLSLNKEFGNEPAAILDKMRADVPELLKLYGELQDAVIKALRKAEEKAVKQMPST